jgi:nitroreductase
METLQAIKARKSVRGFEPRPVPEDVLKSILEAANEAPVGMAAFDTIQLTVIQDRELLQRISDATPSPPRGGTDLYYGAPAVIVISSAEQPAPGLAYANAGDIVENILLAATDLGIDSVYVFGSVIGFANDPTLLAQAGIPADFTVVSSVALGFGTPEAKATPKPTRTIKVNWA